MQPGQEEMFGYRLSNDRIVFEPGLIISTDHVTADGIQVVEVEFRDGKIRKYSGHFLKEERQ